MSGSTGATIARAPPRTDRGGRHRARARRAAARSPTSPSRRTCASARTRGATSEVDADIDRWYEVFPRLGQRRDAAGREHERRRAADARDRPRADVAPEAGAARRAVARPRADRHAGAVRDARRAQPRAGHLDARRRAERQPRARHRARAATCSRPARIVVSGSADELGRQRRRPPARTWGSDRMAALLHPGA